MPGLLRKCYRHADDGSTAGGVCHWHSRADAGRRYSSRERSRLL